MKVNLVEFLFGCCFSGDVSIDVLSFRGSRVPTQRETQKRVVNTLNGQSLPEEHFNEIPVLGDQIGLSKVQKVLNSLRRLKRANFS